ncbi:hypothetical protein HNR06_004978 [Nocardiopsis arvandica]|uniref:DUF1918 domain-containing protein n=1 Tax=Nocardiopsis sinuspersici TaxID=501010 RepID=A0A7Y9XGE7_9ACTN|nr:dsRBD fold-containing protein [Nocardiopsis sinuspersici]NYH55389.1 hypothetical protein [Nocardiopsis sinuspersici]
MRAQVGDRLVVESPRVDAHRRTGVVTGVRGLGGSPPYQVHWSDAERGHDTLVYPGPDAHVEHPPGGTGAADAEEADAMQTTKRWNVDVVVSEESEGDSARTWAEVGLATDEGTALRGHGMARKHPTDMDVPEIGEELAVSRALSDLSRQLRQVAAADINDYSGLPWRPT